MGGDGEAAAATPTVTAKAEAHRFLPDDSLPKHTCQFVFRWPDVAEDGRCCLLRFVSDSPHNCTSELPQPIRCGCGRRAALVRRGCGDPPARVLRNFLRHGENLRHGRGLADRRNRAGRRPPRCLRLAASARWPAPAALFLPQASPRQWDFPSPTSRRARAVKHRQN